MTVQILPLNFLLRWSAAASIQVRRIASKGQDFSITWLPYFSFLENLRLFPSHILGESVSWMKNWSHVIKGPTGWDRCCNLMRSRPNHVEVVFYKYARGEISKWKQDQQSLSDWDWISKLRNQISLRGRFVFKMNGWISSIDWYKDHCCSLFTSWVIKQQQNCILNILKKHPTLGVRCAP